MQKINQAKKSIILVVEEKEEQKISRNEKLRKVEI